jgi:N-acetylglucosamine-6-sulfatase
MERGMSSERTHPARWLLLAAALAIGLSPLAAAAAREPATRPNIVLIMTDDEDVASHRFMPKTRALLENRGTAFDNFFVTYSFCCPSRVSILRGQYPHNTQILGIQPPTGGFVKVRNLGLQNSTIATWLDAAGYHTAYLGKYLNQYVPEEHGVPPGWDDWHVGSDNNSNYNYTLNENGTIVAYGERPEDYLTDVVADKSVRIIERAAAADDPFFLYIATYAPHSPSTWAPRHDGLFEDVPLPRTPSFDEPDVSDKPAIVRNLPPMTGPQIEAMEFHHQSRLRSLQAVDDLVETVVATLEAQGLLDNTYIIYTSDNGHHMGEHRMIAGKTTAYEEDIRVPMIVRGPGVPEGQRIAAMVLNNDLGPTLAELAGAESPPFVDGRSFLPLLEDPNRGWRHSLLIQRRELETHEMDGAARFDAIRTEEWSYVRYGDGDRELYDLTKDPFQLESLVSRADPLFVQMLEVRLAELMNCAGVDCREIEDLPVDAERTALRSDTDAQLSSIQ